MERVSGASEEEQQRLARANYFNISSSKRDLIALYYERETGKKLNKTKDYLTALAIGKDTGIN